MSNVDSSNPESGTSLGDGKPLTPKEFLNTILHELRTPMMVIKGYVEILSKEEGKEHLPEAIKAISASIERINALYEDMAVYTRKTMQNPGS